MWFLLIVGGFTAFGFWIAWQIVKILEERLREAEGPRVQVGPNLWRIGPPDGDCIYEGPLEDWEVAMLNERRRPKCKLRS